MLIFYWILKTDREMEASVVKKKLDYLKLSNLRQKDFLAFLSRLEDALRKHEMNWVEDDFLAFQAENILSKALLFSQKNDQGRKLSVTPLLAQADEESSFISQVGVLRSRKPTSAYMMNSNLCVWWLISAISKRRVSCNCLWHVCTSLLWKKP